MSEELKKFREWVEKNISTEAAQKLDNSSYTFQHFQGACPRCGYCPHCGRGGTWSAPSYPYYPTYPHSPITWTAVGENGVMQGGLT